jgi:hypothetical protein
MWGLSGVILGGVSGGVGGYLDDEVGIEGHADPFQQWDGGYHAACFQTGQRGLGHAGAGGQLDLGQAQGQAAFADGLADQEGLTGLGVSLAVLPAAAAVAGEFLVGGVLICYVSSPPGRIPDGPGCAGFRRSPGARRARATSAVSAPRVLRKTVSRSPAVLGPASR